MHSTSQNAIETSFKVPIPGISHFDLLDIKLQKGKNCQKFELLLLQTFVI